MTNENTENDQENHIKIGSKFGCLEVIDDGSEYQSLIKRRIDDINEEKRKFVQMACDGVIKRHDREGWDGKKTIYTEAYIYKPSTFNTKYDSVRQADFDDAIAKLHRRNEVKRYKCRCRKCDKIRHYPSATLLKNPQYCLRPIHCSSKHTYSVRASNATNNKRQKYCNDETVILVKDKAEVVPSGEYCEKWNQDQQKKLDKKAKEDAAFIAALPRMFDDNYNKDFTGLRYESLDILKCVNERFEATPIPQYNRHRKTYSHVTVFKQYQCRCYLCGKEQLITCDKFGIHPPTQYGVRAYDGYWSAAYCKCHEISSFQWIVTKLLFENHVPYQVEYSFPDLYGSWEHNHLKYDYAIFDENGSIKQLIECQGEQHYMPVDEFGGMSMFKQQQINDEAKREYARKHGIALLEISYKDKRYEKVESILRENGIIP